MLILGRRRGETIEIGPIPGDGGTIRIVVTDLARGKVRLGIEAPRSIPIGRPDRDGGRGRDGAAGADERKGGDPS